MTSFLSHFFVLRVRLIFFVEIDRLLTFTSEEAPLEPVVVLRAEVHFL